jgi:hypothetical protein
MSPSPVSAVQWVVFGCTYLSSVAWWAAVTLAAVGILLLVRRKAGWRRNRRLALGIMLLSAATWSIYFTSTAKWRFTATLLDEEDDRVAEWAYHNVFDVDLDRAVSLAKDDQQFGNIRFYACLRIADLLAISDEQTAKRIFEQVADAPRFLTGFFGTNNLTYGFFIPGQQEGPFSAEEIVKRRLAADKATSIPPTPLR